MTVLLSIGIFLLGISSVPYIIYLAGILSGTKPDPIHPRVEFPKISVIISAYNEENNIGNRIANIRLCNYPNLEIVIIDDCSADSTYRTAKQVLGQTGIPYYLIRNQTRLGTSKSYDLAVRMTMTDIVVTDADTLFKTDAIHLIVARLLSSPDIGAVTGDLQPYQSQNQITKMEQQYRSIYGKMCIWESNIDSTFNFNGALMAFKKQAIDHDGIQPGADDANLAFAAIRNGYRAVYEESAVVYETIPRSFKVQYHQKIRRASGIIKSIWTNRDLVHSKRPFAKLLILRMWTYMISPMCFFFGIILCGPVVWVLAMVSMIIPFCRAFVLNQFYLLMGLLNIKRDVRTWESTSSMEGK